MIEKDDQSQSILKYVPERLMRHLEKNPEPPIEPFSDKLYAAVLFADMQNFTRLAESLAQEDPENGVKRLANYLDIYIGKLVDIINDHGGDIIKFAGDAVFAIWESSSAEDLSHQIYHVAQCGLSIQKQLDQYEVAPGVKLALRVGVGSGQLHELHLGGHFKRWELLFAGDPIGQVGDAGKMAEPGQVVISPQASRILMESGFASKKDKKLKLSKIEDYRKPEPLTKTQLLDIATEALHTYIPRAILVNNSNNGSYAEFRNVTVLFCKIKGLHFSERTPVTEMQMVMEAAQDNLYYHEGSINRFAVDEKGAVLLAAFGLPPLIHDNDPERGVRAALDIRKAMRNLGYDATIGVSTGRAFCGTVGNSTRCEYTMHGANVNLAARLMMHTDSVLCDELTYKSTENMFRFKPQPPVSFKGSLEPVNTYELCC